MEGADLTLASLLFSDWMIFRMSAYSARTPKTLRNDNLLIIERKRTTIALSYMDDAGHHPGLHSCQTLGLWSVGSDRVEDVDQDEEQGDQQSHPT